MVAWKPVRLRWDAKVIGTEPDQFLCIYLAQKSNLEPTVPAHVTFGMVVVRPRRAALHNLAPARCGATRPFLGRIGPDCPDYVSELGAGARNPSRLAVNPYCTDLLRNVYFAVRFHDLHKFMYVLRTCLPQAISSPSSIGTEPKLKPSSKRAFKNGSK